MSAASFWEVLKAGALRQPGRPCEWPGCKNPPAETEKPGEAA